MTVPAGFRDAMSWVGAGFDAVGVLVIAGGACWALLRLAALRQDQAKAVYRRFRQDLGGAIVLGLEFLVAGDIIRSVAVAPSLENVAVLGLIVLIRTFLSMALQIELEGRLPWQSGKPCAENATSGPPVDLGQCRRHPDGVELPPRDSIQPEFEP